MEGKMINIGADFTRYPAGRFRTDGIYSGERFRQDYLVPALRNHARVTLLLDGPIGYGSSFLEEAFGGLIRNEGFSIDHVLNAFELVSRDQSLVDEIREYISATRH